MVQHARYLRSFGRVRGKSLRPLQRSLMDHLLPKLAFSSSASVAGYTDIALEIGFGGGEHLAALAKAKPATLCIGAEPFENGVAKLLRAVDAEKISNIRIHMGDAREVIAALPDASVQHVYLLFPDPWPKAKHFKRRIFTHAFLETIARIQPCGGVLQLATDHADYACWMLEHLQQTPYYVWQAESKADWENPPAIWAETKYQRKTTQQGRAPMFFKCVRG